MLTSCFLPAVPGYGAHYITDSKGVFLRADISGRSKDVGPSVAEGPVERKPQGRRVVDAAVYREPIRALLVYVLSRSPNLENLG